MRILLLLFTVIPVFCEIAAAQGVITIDHQTQRYVGTESTFDRGKYLTFHNWFKKEDADFEAFKRAYNLDPDYNGSRLFNNPAQKHKQGQYPPVKKKHSGVREVSAFVSTSSPKWLFYKKEVDYSGEDISAFSKEAAAFAASYFRDEAEHVPKYYEPFNEPMIKAVTFYPEGRGGKYIKDKINPIITKMIEHHLHVARAIHATPELANVKVAGFGSAFPEFEANDFGLWNARYKQFIDMAGEDMDLYTVHLYDGSGVNNKDGRRSGSNSEAILDMIEAYSYIALGEVKPYAVTEYGRLVPDQPDYKTTGNYDPLTNSQAVRSQMHMVMNFIERGDQLLLSTPFTVGKKNPKTKYSKSALWIKTEDGSYELTPRKYFFEVWKDVKGDRVRVQSTNIDVQTQAFVSGNQLFVVLNNLNDSLQRVELALVDPKGVKKVEVKRLNIYENQLPTLTVNKQKKAPSTLDIAYGETVVLTYTFKSAIPFTKQLYSKKYYADTYLTPIVADADARFTFQGVEAGSGTATLRLGVGRDHGLSLTPEITVNGHPLELTGDLIRGYDQHSRRRFFGTLEIPVDMAHLVSGENRVDIRFPDAGGHVSSMILQVQRETSTRQE